MSLRSLLLAFAAFLCAVATQAGTGQVRRPPFSIPNEYIVILESKPNQSSAIVAADIARVHGGRVGRVWNDVIHGFTIHVPEAAATAIARDPRVAFVEQDSQVFLSASQNTTIPPTGAEAGAGSLWALDRIDQRTSTATGDGTYTYCDDGFGVKIYIVDNGVLKSHQEFYRSSTDTTTRVENGVSFTTEWNPAPGETVDYGTNPCNVLHNGGSGQIRGSHGDERSESGGRTPDRRCKSCHNCAGQSCEL